MSEEALVSKQEPAGIWTSPVTNMVFQAFALVLAAIIPLVASQTLPAWAIWIGWIALVALGLMASVSITKWIVGAVGPRLVRRRVNNQIKDPINLLMTQLEQLLNSSHTRSMGCQLNQAQSIGVLSQEAASALRAHLTALSLELRFVDSLLRARKIDSIDVLRASSDVALMYLRACGEVNTLIHNWVQRLETDPSKKQTVRSLLRDWSDVRMAANVVAQEMTRLVGLANISKPTGIGSYFPTVAEA